MSVDECGVGELIMTPDAHCSENRKGLEALLALLDCIPPAGGAPDAGVTLLRFALCFCLSAHVLELELPNVRTLSSAVPFGFSL